MDRRYEANGPGSRRTLIRFFKLLLPLEVRFLLCKNKTDFCYLNIVSCPTLFWSIHSSNNHLTVAFLVTWPVRVSEAGVHFVLIQTLVLFI